MFRILSFQYPAGRAVSSNWPINAMVVIEKNHVQSEFSV